MKNLRRLSVAALATMLIGCGVQGQTQRDPLKGFRNPSEGFDVARQGMFFVNGEYTPHRSRRRRSRARPRLNRVSTWPARCT